MALFGRDSVVASWEALLLSRNIALSTAEVLARHQGMTDNPVTAEAPGKILHEMRLGERADPGLGGTRVYFGSIDSTPLFIMLVGQLLRFGASNDELERLMPAVEDAVEWLRHFGDIDGDGFIEYETDRKAFLWNQGWKDSRDGVNFADGRVAEGPIALCEVQGYAYSAYLAAADLREHLGRPGADDLRREASVLRRRRQEVAGGLDLVQSRAPFVV
jgi:glycogen debranching enzyme